MAERPDPLVAVLAAELKGLRRGRGLRERQSVSRLGARARQVLGVDEQEDAEVARAKTLSALQHAMDGLPERDREVLSIAFGLDIDLPHYEDRVLRIAGAKRVTTRTVRRWVDAALHALAAEIGDDLSRVDEVPWWTDRLVVALALDRPQVEAMEVHRLVSAVDDLDEVELDLVDVGGRGRIAVFYGGDLQVPDGDGAAFVLKLPKALKRGESHELAVNLRLPRSFRPQPSLLRVPRWRVGRMELRVRFPKARRPSRVIRIADAPRARLDAPAQLPPGTLVDAGGEVHVTFGNPATGLISGLRWFYD